MDVTGAVAYGIVLLSLWSLVLVALLGQKRAAKGTVRHDRKSRFGLLLQMIAYAIVYVFPRPYFSPFFPMSKFAEIIVAVLAVLLALGSLWFCYAAALALGKQWALVARVIEGHELVVRGPYAVVRNPIYLAMLGMLIAAGVTSSHWPELLVALVVFSLGTWIRIRAEENILRGAFGAKFEDYARRVPALLPGLF